MAQSLASSSSAAVPRRWRGRALAVTALAALLASSGCFTTIGGLAGHRSKAEQRRAKARCVARKVPDDYCPVPRDHTIAGMVIGAGVDTLLVSFIYVSAMQSAFGGGSPD